MRIDLERAGLMPLVETAIVNGPRFMTEGTMKLHKEGESTTFTRQEASLETFLFISRESVAAITRNAFLRSPFLYCLGICFIMPFNFPLSILFVSSGLITVISAPALRRVRTFLSATLPPPITTALLPLRFRNAG